jgi:uncharacterized membrane-anchored protein
VKFHPERDQLTLELHARPIRPARAPLRISHLAFGTGEHGGEQDFQDLVALCRKYGKPEPSPEMKHFNANHGPFTVKWDRQTEFSTYTFLRSESFDAPFEETVFNLLPAEWKEAKFGDVLVAVHLAVSDGIDAPLDANRLSRWFDGNEVFANLIEKERVEIYGDLRTHDDGFDRMYLRAGDLGPELLGQTVQRVLELTTYWRLSLLSLPIARASSPKLERIERGLAKIAAELAEADPERSDESLLDPLAQLSAELETIIADSSYRYRASTAYFEIVESRLRQLGAVSFNGYIHLFDYLMRRIDPALRTCWSVQSRQEAISKRASRLSSLLRTGIEVKVEQQNRDLLDSMNRRAAQSLAIQRTVEGLSVVAISYYAVSLLKYLLEGMVKAKLVTVDPTITSAALLPVLVVALWFFLHRLTRRALKKPDGK